MFCVFQAQHGTRSFCRPILDLCHWACLLVWEECMLRIVPMCTRSYYKSPFTQYNMPVSSTLAEDAACAGQMLRHIRASQQRQPQVTFQHPEETSTAVTNYVHKSSMSTMAAHCGVHPLGHFCCFIKHPSKLCNRIAVLDVLFPYGFGSNKLWLFSDGVS